MNNRTKIGSVARASILLSILIALSGMAAIVLADDPPDICKPNRFSGDVTLNGAPASNGTVINAYIDGAPRGSIVVGSPGEYEGMTVMGSTSDDGKNVTFTVCGANAEQNGTWIAWIGPVQILNLTAVDNEAPAVESANATPPSIVADGVETTQLNVTVIDGCQCTVGNVTVNLSAIGGDAARVMDRIGDTDVYSVTVNATEGTARGAYDLQVNASDVFGKCNTSVYIELEIEITTTYAKGDLDHNGDVADAVDVAMMLQASVGDITATSEYNLDGNDQNADAVDVAMMLQASVGDITL